jgi:hypothetical protein
MCPYGTNIRLLRVGERFFIFEGTGVKPLTRPISKRQKGGLPGQNPPPYR